MIKCPVCGQYEFRRENDFDICSICGWENDAIQLENPDEDSGANQTSLNEYRQDYILKIKQNSDI